MRLLLDTHTLLWWLTDDASLSAAARRHIARANNTVLVETQEQLAFLQAAGCDEGQGYYFSRPMVSHQFAKLLQAGKLATVSN